MLEDNGYQVLFWTGELLVVQKNQIILIGPRFPTTNMCLLTLTAEPNPMKIHKYQVWNHHYAQNPYKISTKQ